MHKTKRMHIRCNVYISIQNGKICDCGNSYIFNIIVSKSTCTRNMFGYNVIFRLIFPKHATSPPVMLFISLKSQEAEKQTSVIHRMLVYRTLLLVMSLVGMKIIWWGYFMGFRRITPGLPVFITMKNENSSSWVTWKKKLQRKTFRWTNLFFRLLCVPSICAWMNVYVKIKLFHIWKHK